MGEPATAGGDVRAFRSGLRELKREGCALLVVGHVHGELLDAVSARLLGDVGGSRDRTRLFGLLDRGLGRVATRLSLAGGAAPGPHRVVTTADERTAVVDWAGIDRDDVTRVPDVAGFVEALPAAIDDAAGRGGFAPGELRVCVDSLRPLVRAPAVSETAFVGTVREAVRSHRGMAHLVLPARPDGDLAASLAPAFDAVVAVRTRDARREQRWHLRNVDYRTAWMEF